MFQERQEKIADVFLNPQKDFEDSFYPGDRITYYKNNLKMPVEVEILQVLQGQTLWVKNSRTKKEYKINLYHLTEKYKFTSRPGRVPDIAAG